MQQELASFHSISGTEALSKLNCSKDGLSSEEADVRLKQYGPNELKEKKKRTILEMFVGEFKDFLILLLIAAAIISAGISIFRGENDFLDSIAIIAIVIINSIIGVYQEYQAGKAIEALRKMVKSKARVIRDGKEHIIDTANLVPGDIIVLTEGDKVPGDARLLELHNLEVEEASLTGESVPVIKRADVVLEDKAVVNEQKNMVFMATLITKGTGRALVCFTGKNTQIGKIADMVQGIEDEQTPLQLKLEELGKQLGKLAIAAVLIVFIVGAIRSFFSTGLHLDAIEELFLISVSLAVAAIPEGLPAVVTIALAIGVQRMAKRNSIIRRLAAAEGLGSATVICSDKTGTLTKNEMTVRKIFTASKSFDVDGEGYGLEGKFREKGKEIDPNKEPDLLDLLKSSVLCNNASLNEKAGKTGIIGDPTEACLLVCAKKGGIDYLTEQRKRKELDELVFDSTRKMMSVIYDEEEAGIIVYIKGAPELLIENCGFYQRNGRQEKLGPEFKRLVLERNAEFASSGLRVLGFAYRPLKLKKKKDFTIDEVEKELVFLGLMAMMDPPRTEVKKAISVCKQAGIRTIMITGDNELTAKAIAKELGMFDERTDKILNGRELADIDEKDLEKLVGHISVFARVSPEHKLKIVTALQRMGEIVAMTGDGVNDAPAIKKADIGVAMGITGTDVAKESADMIITDDNFASIVSAVEEGRIIYENIMKAVKYLLSCNIGEVLVIFLAILVGWDSPLIPIQILWMNLATDALPALALAADTKAKDIMGRKPRSPKEKVLTKAAFMKLAFIGILITIGTLALFWYELDTEKSIEKARTVAFSTIIFFQLFAAMSWHAGNEPLLNVGIFKNRFLVFAVLIGFAAQVAIVQTGVLEVIFKTVPLLPIEWFSIILVSSSVLFVGELAKYLGKRRGTQIDD